MTTEEFEPRSRFRGIFRTDPLRSVVTTLDFTPGLVTAIYCALGFLALYFSDVYLPQTIQDPVILQREQAIKGGVEIVLTAGLIFVLTKRSRLALQRHKARLENLQAERSVLHRVFRHNLRQELNLVAGHSKLIRSMDETGHFSTHCTVIEDASDRIEQYVEKARQFEKLFEPGSTLRAVDLAAMVADDDHVDALRRSDGIELTVRLPEEARAIGHPRVKSAFHEILDNAVKHTGPDRTKIDISVETSSPGVVELTVTDNGPGIPAIERRSLERMEELPLTHSGGLGLWFAKLSCIITGGDLVFENVPEGGSAVTLRLPAEGSLSLRQRVVSLMS